MSVLILTVEEAEELVEHLASRPDLWVQRGGAWIRVSGVEICDHGGHVKETCEACRGTSLYPIYGLAFKIRSELADGLSALTIARVAWSEEGSIDYARWLLEKYTAWKIRQDIIKTLRKFGANDQVNQLSRALCSMQGGAYVRHRERREVLHEEDRLP